MNQLHTVLALPVLLTGCGFGADPDVRAYNTCLSRIVVLRNNGLTETAADALPDRHADPGLTNHDFALLVLCGTVAPLSRPMWCFASGLL